MRRETPTRGLSWRKLTARVAAGGLLVASGVTAFTGVAMASNAPTKYTICHATNSETNPYVSESVDASAIDASKTANPSNHMNHTGPIWAPGDKAAGITWGDIIPAVSGVTGGLNNTTTGLAILANGCAVPSGGTVSVSGACAVAPATGYTWTVTGTLKAGAPASTATGTWSSTTSAATGTFSTAAASFSTLSADHALNLALDPTSTAAGWTLTTPNPTAPATCGTTPTASGTVSFSGACNATTGLYDWMVTAASTTIADKSTGGGWAPSAGGTGGNWSTNSTGTGSFSSSSRNITLTISSTSHGAGWSLASGTATATACSSSGGNPSGTVTVSGACNTAGTGYDWTVVAQSSTIASEDTSGSWTQSSGSDTGPFSTDASGNGSFSTGPGENNLDLGLSTSSTTAGWSLASNTASATACQNPNTGQADPQVSASKACKTGISVALSNMDGTADTTFTVTKPNGTSVTVPVRAGQIVRSSYGVKEDTTGTVSVSAPGLATKTVTYQKNCTQVLGEKVVKTPKTTKPTKPTQVLGEKVTQLPFTGDNTRKELLVGASLLMIGALLCGLAGRRRDGATPYGA